MRPIFPWHSSLFQRRQSYVLYTLVLEPDQRNNNAMTNFWAPGLLSYHVLLGWSLRLGNQQRIVERIALAGEQGQQWKDISSSVRYTFFRRPCFAKVDNCIDDTGWHISGAKPRYGAVIHRRLMETRRYHFIRRPMIISSLDLIFFFAENSKLLYATEWAMRKRSATGLRKTLLTYS